MIHHVSKSLRVQVQKLEAAIRFADDDLTSARNAINTCPPDTDTLVNTGCIHYKVNEEPIFKFTIMPSLKTISFLKIQENDYEKALSKFQSAFQASGFEPQLLYNMALCHYKMKEYASAIKYIGKT